MSNKGRENRRRIHFIDKPFQSRYILVLAAFVAFSIVAFFLVAWVTWPRPGAARSVDAADAVLSLVLVVLAATMVVVVLGLRFSHRIAGPIYALGRNMSYVIQGRLTGDLRLRQGDEFQNLATRFNAMLKTLRERERADLEHLSAARARTDDILELAAAGAGADVDRLRVKIEDLKSDLDALSEKKAGYLT